MIDKEVGEVGVIEEILDMPQQEMTLIRYKKREVLIPLNEELILEIDEKKKQVMVDLPEGLLDL